MDAKRDGARFFDFAGQRERHIRPMLFPVQGSWMTDQVDLGVVLHAQIVDRDGLGSGFAEQYRVQHVASLSKPHRNPRRGRALRSGPRPCAEDGLSGPGRPGDPRRSAVRPLSRTSWLGGELERGSASREGPRDGRPPFPGNGDFVCVFPPRREAEVDLPLRIEHMCDACGEEMEAEEGRGLGAPDIRIGRLNTQVDDHGCQSASSLPH